MSMFQAVWPIVDPGMRAADLVQQAREDLPTVAARHNSRITGEPKFEVRDGRRVPGSQGAAYVITCVAPADAIQPRNYGGAHPLGVSQ